jgi:serine/threonine protein kinase/lipoprotein NlpI
MSDVIARLSASMNGRYRVERELGQGGMATVYLAHDLRHDREVAVKVLRPELAAALGGERFLQEIRTTARLQHPHILPLFDSGEADGFLYYVMPYVEGESLRARLDRERQLPVEDVVALTRQVASALDYAHQQGIIHRDIKPGNILLNHDEAVVADFGIALAVRAAGGQRLTETGLSLGTPQYMSPEQAGADRQLDARSDLYSLGAVVYEMLCGEPPHTGPTTPAIIAKLYSQAPTPPRVTRAGLPEPVDAAVLRALAKVPADRFGSAAEFVAAMTAPARAASSLEQSLVVLPLANVSPDADTEYFADGLTEELIADLSKVRALRVISRSSSMRLRGTSSSPRELGAALGVRYVMEGSVRRAGDQLRVVVQLLDASTEEHVWSEKYTGVVQDVFEMQERLSRSIVDALRVSLTGEESRRLAERPFPTLAVFDCYLRARRGIMSFSAAGFQEALSHLERGLSALGENVLLLKGMGLVRFQQLNAGVTDDRGLIREIEEYAERITRLEPDSPHAPVLRGLARILDGKFRAALRDLRRAHQSDPGDTDTMLWLGVGYLSTGQTSAARDLFERLAAIDPLTPLNHLLVGYAAFFDGRFSDAVQPVRRALAMDDDAPVLLWCAVRILAAAGELPEAEAAVARLRRAHPDSLFARAATAFGHAMCGRDGDAIREITPAVEDWALHDGEWAQFLADAYALAGRRDEALAWLGRAVAAEFINHRFLAVHDPFLAELRADPEFQAVIATARDEWTAFDRELGSTADHFVAGSPRSQSPTR